MSDDEGLIYETERQLKYCFVGNLIASKWCFFILEKKPRHFKTLKEMNLLLKFLKLGTHRN